MEIRETKASAIFISCYVLRTFSKELFLWFSYGFIGLSFFIVAVLLAFFLPFLETIIMFSYHNWHYHAIYQKNVQNLVQRAVGFPLPVVPTV